MMFRVTRRAFLICAVVITAGILLATSSAVAYTKYYAIKNYNNTAHTHARVTLIGIEIITETWTWPASWNQPQFSYPSHGGSIDTCICFGDSNNPRQPDELVFLKWTTSDNHCQLAELCWAWPNCSYKARAYPQQIAGVPGGGEVTYDKKTGEVIWILTNHTGAALDLSSMRFGVVYGPRPGVEPDLHAGSSKEVQRFLHSGLMPSMVLPQVQAMIDDLQQQITDNQRTMDADLYTTLQRLLSAAETEVSSALGGAATRSPAWLHPRWELAAGHISNFTGQVIRGDIRSARKAEWAETGKRIVAMLRSLSTIPAQELPPPERTPPCPPGFPGDSARYYEWPLTTLPANAYTAMVVDGAGGWERSVTADDAAYYVLEGVLDGPGGDPLLRWAELCGAPREVCK